MMDIKPLDLPFSLSTAAPTATKRSSNAANNANSNNTNAVDRIDWPRPTILRFIDDYRNLRVLWDANTKGYHMKQTKCEALKALSLKYGTEIRAIRSKIKSLRSSFHREHGKVLSNRRKGISYQPMWFAYEAIRFILDGSESTTAAATATAPTPWPASLTLTSPSSLASALVQQQKQLKRENENDENDERDGDGDEDDDNDDCGGDGDGDGDGDNNVENDAADYDNNNSCSRNGKGGGGAGGGRHRAGAHATQRRQAANDSERDVKNVKNDVDENNDDDDDDCDADNYENNVDDDGDDNDNDNGNDDGNLNAEEKLALILYDNNDKYGGNAAAAAAAFAAAVTEMGFGETALKMLTATAAAATNFKTGDDDDSYGDYEIAGDGDVDGDGDTAGGDIKRIKLETITTPMIAKATTSRQKRSNTRNQRQHATMAPTTSSTTNVNAKLPITKSPKSPPTPTATTPTPTATASTTSVRAETANLVAAAAAELATTAATTCFLKNDGITNSGSKNPANTKTDAPIDAANDEGNCGATNTSSSGGTTAANAAAAAAAAAFTATTADLANTLVAAANLPSSTSMSPHSAAAATLFLNAIAAAGFSRNTTAATATMIMGNADAVNNSTAATTITTTTATTTTTTATKTTSATTTSTIADEPLPSTTFRNDLENDSQNYCTISADDVKTEIIESDSTEAMGLMGLDQRSHEYRTNFFKHFELRQRDNTSVKNFSPTTTTTTTTRQSMQQQQQPQQQQSPIGRKRKYHSYQQPQQQPPRPDDALNLAKMHSHFLTGQARAQDLTTHSSGCAMTAIPAGIQLSPLGNGSSKTYGNGSLAALKTKLLQKQQQQQQQTAASATNAATTIAGAVAAAATATESPSASTSSTSLPIGQSHASNHIDEYGVFGEYVAMTIRKLKTTKAKIAIKHLINNLLYEGELGKYDHGIPATKEPPQLYKA